MYGTVNTFDEIRSGRDEKSQEPVAKTNFIIVAILAGFIFLLYIASYPTTKTGSLKKSSFSALTMSVEREYKSDAVMFPYPFLDNAFLMEPHRENKVFVSGCGGNDVEKECSFSWTLLTDEGVAALSGSASDSVFTVTPVKTGKYSLVIDSGDGNVVRFAIWVKYVRRELESLTESDRNEFLDALRVLWDVSTVDGQKIYGERYKSLWYFATVHNDAGANRKCDEFHASNGFVNNHVILGSYLEQSLQLVNPRVALHYMEYAKYFSSADFTKHLKNQLDGGAWTEILSGKYFGSNDPYTGNINEVFAVVIFHLP
jgi:hypothetical protein